MKREGIIYAAMSLGAVIMAIYSGNLTLTLSNNESGTTDVLIFALVPAVMGCIGCLYGALSFFFLRRGVIEIQRTASGLIFRSLTKNEDMKSESIRLLKKIGSQLDEPGKPRFVLFSAQGKIWVCTEECFSNA